MRIILFEYGRGPGGRTARRRITLENNITLSFDHAAPFFTAVSDEFRNGALQKWISNGHAAQWDSSSTSFNEDQVDVKQNLCNKSLSSTTNLTNCTSD